MSRFNLIDEKWIPVRMTDGTRTETGILGALLDAREIAAIEDPSPLVVAALHRFLLAVLYRALQGPSDIEQCRSLFASGLPGGKITEYLEKWRHRFWLSDNEHPFGQIAGFEPKSWRAWTVLAAEHNADNAKVLFDHVDISAPGGIPAGSAACWILATQTFSVSCGKSELSHTGTAPSATSALVLPVGRNLADTLLYSLVEQNREVIENDLPLWERTPETLESLRRGLQRSPAGLADRYTWRIRTIRLAESASGEIEKLAFASGVGVAFDDQRDPMVGYRIDEKKGKLPIQFRERGLWRDFDALLPDESRLAPQVIEHVMKLTGRALDRFPRSVMVLGQANDKAKIEFWRMERFVLPEALATNRNVRSEIRQLLKDAEEAQKQLWLSCRSFARHMLCRGDREPAGKDIGNFVAQMPCIGWYWSALERRFHGVLEEYTLEADPDLIRRRWLASVRDTLKDAWGQHAASASFGDAWTIRALVKAEGAVRRKVKELDDEIAQYPEEEEP